MTITREMAQRVFNALGGWGYKTDRYGRMTTALYMINPNHAAINVLYNRFKRENGVPLNYPLSDTQRTQFELSLLNDETIAEIMGMVERKEMETKKEEKCENER